MPDADKKNIRDFWLSPILLILLLIIFVAIVVGKFGWHQTITLSPDVKQATYTSMFVNLFFIALIVERFIEVFNSIWRRKGRQERVRALENAAPGAEKISAQKEMDFYRSKTETLAMYCGFAIGILIGLAGVHTLQVIFNIDALSGTQKSIFQAVDISLTAGLIAGGSKGINAITSLMGSFLTVTKERAEAQKPDKS
jgi:small-conductance mechanosensitive channel